jgi:predicted phosphodiesterase
MRIQLMSDLHTCFYRFPLEFLESLTFEPVDVLVLAGDIVVPGVQDPFNDVYGALTYLAGKAAHVVYVTGNHCYYHSDKDLTEAKLREMLPKNFHWLQNNSVTIDGQKFFGGTMWFKDAPDHVFYQHYLNDFNLIHGFHRWVYQENRKFHEAAMAEVTPDTIVVTHHMPSPTCVAPKYKDSPLNRFFLSDETEVIEACKPGLWLFGHTHLPVDVAVDQTRMVCNPHGYPTERGVGDYPPVVFTV